ncbi:MAG: S-layer homology domain-containing protein [Thermomicrobiales bacterium]
MSTLPALVFLCLLATSNASPVSAAGIAVTRFDDPEPNGCQVDDCSLREAVIKANAANIAGSAVTSTILLQIGTYHLTREIVSNDGPLYTYDTPGTGDLDFISNATHTTSKTEIFGQGAANTIIDAHFIDRAIDIGLYATVSINGLSIRNGDAHYSNILGGETHTHGGAIHVHGTLFMNQATVSDSVANLDSQKNGGGIFAAPNTTTQLVNVTIARNRAVTGGGLEGGGNVYMNSVSVVNNSVGGGLRLYTGSAVSIYNSIIADNYNPIASGGNDCAGSILNLYYSLVEDSTCNALFESGVLGGDPALVPFGHTGDDIYVYLPATNSSVIDNGDPTNCPEVDELGTPRPQDGNNDTILGCDMGAAEVSFPTIFVIARDTAGNPINAPISPAPGEYRYRLGNTQQFSAASNATHVFLGWEIGNLSMGWSPSIDMLIRESVEVIAIYAPRPHFDDVPPGQLYTEAVHNLAARGLILGYGNGRFGPDDIVNRAQMAALIARATPAGPGTPPSSVAPNCVADSWDCEDWGNDFVDRGGLVASLWRNIGTLQHYGVASGYDGVHFGPNNDVTYAQTISFITRTMVKKGYWVNRPDAPQIFPGVPAAHDLDIRTFEYYTGNTPSGPGPWSAAQWNSGATRGWFARALWAALLGYWGNDAPGMGGYVP